MNELRIFQEIIGHFTFAPESENGTCNATKAAMQLWFFLMNRNIVTSDETTPSGAYSLASFGRCPEFQLRLGTGRLTLYNSIANCRKELTSATCVYIQASMRSAVNYIAIMSTKHGAR